MSRLARLATGLLITCTGVIMPIACSLSDGLGPVEGVEGALQVSGEWPDSIKAVALIVLDDLVLDDAANHLITFSDPLMPGDTLGAYFIQLHPGLYYLVAAGLTVEPALFLANMEDYTAAGEIPIVILDTDLSVIATPVLIRENEVAQVNRTISF